MTKRLLDIGRRELASNHPNPHRLETVVDGLGTAYDQPTAEMLVAFFERTDLPGWLRADAADKLGFNDFISDRRTRLYRRSRDAAIRGLNEDSIEVRFGSMYLIGALCANRTPRQQDFAKALPKLRQIARTDKRLSPGFWWPMSAEAEDVIGCIETGKWPERDAGDRWPSSGERGPRNRE